jgi:hypothetical protein
LTPGADPAAMATAVEKILGDAAARTADPDDARTQDRDPNSSGVNVSILRSTARGGDA